VLGVYSSVKLLQVISVLLCGTIAYYRLWLTSQIDYYFMTYSQPIKQS